jgi:hypothetical protein
VRATAAQTSAPQAVGLHLKVCARDRRQPADEELSSAAAASNQIREEDLPVVQPRREHNHLADLGCNRIRLLVKMLEVVGLVLEKGEDTWHVEEVGWLNLRMLRNLQTNEEHLKAAPQRIRRQLRQKVHSSQHQQPTYDSEDDGEKQSVCDYTERSLSFVKSTRTPLRFWY